jgi:hypothetical protein
MAVSRDPAEWTPEQRAAVLAAELGALLDAVPTARTTWAEEPGATEARERRAERISARMTRVYQAGR